VSSPSYEGGWTQNRAILLKLDEKKRCRTLTLTAPAAPHGAPRPAGQTTASQGFLRRMPDRPVDLGGAVTFVSEHIRDNTYAAGLTLRATRLERILLGRAPALSGDFLHDDAVFRPHHQDLVGEHDILGVAYLRHLRDDVAGPCVHLDA